MYYQRGFFQLTLPPAHWLLSSLSHIFSHFHILTSYAKQFYSVPALQYLDTWFDH